VGYAGSEEEEEMAEWIEQVQQAKGLGQEAIEGLLSLEYEGGECEM
jgi:hypothetical protein